MKSLAKKSDARPTSGNGRQVTKKAQLIKLLGRKSGADIVALSDKLGWQQHTTRAALSGLRKATNGSASGINDNGAIVGSQGYLSRGTPVFKAVLWSEAGMVIDLNK